MTRASEPSFEPSDPADGLTDRQLERLDRLAEAGLEIALALERRAKAADAAPADQPIDLDAVALGYSRVSRGVRLCILLQSKLVADRDGRARAAAERRVLAENGPAREALEHEAVARDRVARILERVIKAEHDDLDEVDRLVLEAVERVEDEDCYGAVTTRPMSEMVADICRDLDLHPDWTAMAKEAWAVEEIRSGQVGEPFRAIPLQLDEGEVRSGGDGPVAVRLTGHPHPQPFPHQGGREAPAPS